VEVFGTRRHSNKHLREYLGERAKYQTLSRVTKEEEVRENLVGRSFTEENRYQLGVDEGKPKVSRVIGLGEFSVVKRIFDTTVSNLERR